AAAMMTAELYDEQRRRRDAAELARRQAAFVADAAAILSRSLEYEQTLAAIAKLAVPEIADLCAVHIVQPDGTLQSLAVAHVDSRKLEVVRSLEEKYPADPESIGGVYEVVRT